MGIATARAVIGSNTVKVEVKILEQRQAYGRTDYLVTPVAGSGEAWISGANLVLSEAAAAE